MSRCEPKKTEIARADNRSAFPATAAIVDKFRSAFGVDQVKLVYADEGGKTIGKPLPEPKRWLDADGWLKGSELVKQENQRAKK